MTCPHCNSTLVAIDEAPISPEELLRVAANMRPPLCGPIPVQVIEAAFMLSCLIDVEITRLASTPAQRDRMLALVVQHIEDRIAET